MLRIRDRARQETDKELEDIAKKLREIYSRAEKELSKKADDYFLKFDHDDKIKRQMVADGKLSHADYIKWRRGKVFVGKHWTNMKEQAAMNLYNVNVIANDYINGRLPDVYTTVYNIRAGEISAVVPQISFELADPQTIKTLSLDNGQSFLPYRKLDPAKDIPWNMKRINSELLQGILQGESMPQMASRLVKVCNGNEKAAMRTARTVVNCVENQARLKSATDAQDMGCIEVKMWLSAHDGRVRDWHVDADNDYGYEEQAIPVDEPFEVMGEDLMYPSDPSGSPENVYNCRCCMLTKTVGFKSILPPDKQGAIRVVGVDYGEDG